MADNIPQVFVLALLFDERLVRDLLSRLEKTVVPQILVSPRRSILPTAAQASCRQCRSGS